MGHKPWFLVHSLHTSEKDLVNAVFQTIFKNKKIYTKWNWLINWLLLSAKWAWSQLCQNTLYLIEWWYPLCTNTFKLIIIVLAQWNSSPCTDRQVASLGHIILLQIQLSFSITRRKWQIPNYICLAWHTIYPEHYITDAVEVL